MLNNLCSGKRLEVNSPLGDLADRGFEGAAIWAGGADMGTMGTQASARADASGCTHRTSGDCGVDVSNTGGGVSKTVETLTGIGIGVKRGVLPFCGSDAEPTRRDAVDGTSGLNDRSGEACFINAGADLDRLGPWIEGIGQNEKG